MTSYLDGELISSSGRTPRSQSTVDVPTTPSYQPQSRLGTPQRFGGSRTGSRTAGSSGGSRQQRSTDQHQRPYQHDRNRNNGGHRTHTPHGRGHQSFKREQEPIPPVAEGNIRVITIGGFEEIGKNMIAYEIGNDIIVVDAGFQFQDEFTPGVDYILPNTKYLEENKDRIRGAVITHGHLDHIGGLPFVWPLIGNPPIYCLKFTSLMIQKRQDEFKEMPPLDIREVQLGDEVKMGDQTVGFFGITHTIPDSMGVKIKTPWGNIINQADFKLDQVDEVVSEAEEKVYSKLAEEKTLLLMADSTNQENPGWSTPEWKVHRDLETLISENKGRIFLAAFASQIERLTKIIEIAEQYNRSVVLEGRSMKGNIEVAKLAGALNVKPTTIISAEESLSLPPHKVIVLTTGAQGEEHAGLMRMATKNHKVITFNEWDTVILSSSIIPGNETKVARLKDAIARSGAKIVTYRTSELYVHGSGHGNREEVRWLHMKLKPQFFIPQHGTHYMLQLHKQLAMECGMTKEQIVVPDDGSIVEIQEEGTKIVKMPFSAPNELVTVDGFSIGDAQDVVLRDRQTLSQDGIFLVIMALDSRTGKLRKSPDIISRGFIFLREERDLINECRMIVKRTVEKYASQTNDTEFDKLKGAISDQLRKLLLQRTAKRPLVIPVIIGM